MRVAHVIAGLHNPAAGTSYTLLRLVDALARHDVAGQVHTLCPLPGHLAMRSDIVGYPAVRIIPRLGVSPAMRRGLASAGADILHNNGVWMMPNAYAGRVAWERRVPLVLSPHGMFSEWAMAFSRGRKQVAWWCLGQRHAVNATTCFHATSEIEARDVRRLGFLQPIAVIPNGVDLPEPGAAREPADQRGRHKMLFLSRLHPKKGVPILLRAWQRIEDQHPDWELVIAGPDEAGHLSEVRALASELGLETVVFVGPAYNSAKDALYRSADVFVLPTRSENFGMAVGEALAYGLPVITTTGAPWQELNDRACGWCIELSEGNLVEALRAAMNLPEHLRKQMGDRGRRWMEESYGWPGIAGEMKRVYEWVLGGGPTPTCVLTS